MYYNQQSPCGANVGYAYQSQGNARFTPPTPRTPQGTPPPVQSQEQGRWGSQTTFPSNFIPQRQSGSFGATQTTLPPPFTGYALPADFDRSKNKAEALPAVINGIMDTLGFAKQSVAEWFSLGTSDPTLVGAMHSLSQGAPPNQFSPAVLSSALLAFFNGITDSIIPSKAYTVLQKVAQEPSPIGALNLCRVVVDVIPAASSAALEVLLLFLNESGIPAASLAGAFANSIVRPSPQPTTAAPHPQIAHVVELLISEAPYVLKRVPNTMTIPFDNVTPAGSIRVVAMYNHQSTYGFMSFLAKSVVEAKNCIEGGWLQGKLNGEDSFFPVGFFALDYPTVPLSGSFASLPRTPSSQSSPPSSQQVFQQPQQPQSQQQQQQEPFQQSSQQRTTFQLPPPPPITQQQQPQQRNTFQLPPPPIAQQQQQQLQQQQTWQPQPQRSQSFPQQLSFQQQQPPPQQQGFQPFYPQDQGLPQRQLSPPLQQQQIQSFQQFPQQQFTQQQKRMTSKFQQQMSMANHPSSGSEQVGQAGQAGQSSQFMNCPETPLPQVTYPSSHKVVVIGAGGVGKSAMTIRFVQNEFIVEYDPTIEDSYRKQFSVDNIPCCLNILDTAGQEEFSAMRDTFMRSGDGFIIVYSLIEQKTFTEVRMYYEKCQMLKDESDLPVVIVGNKADLLSSREVRDDQIDALQKELNKPFFLASAKENQNIEIIFETVVREIRKKFLAGLNSKQPTKKSRFSIKKCPVL